MHITKKTTGSPGRPAASLERDARELLLAAATDLFAEHGIAATTFAMIANRAGLTPAMLHYYFKNREQLLDVVVEERLAPLIASVWNPVEADAAPEEVIRGIVERMLAGIDRMPWIPSTWMREVLNEGGLLRSRMLRQLPFDKIKILSEAVARGQASRNDQSESRPRTDCLLNYRAGDAAHGHGAFVGRSFRAQNARQGCNLPPHHRSTAQWFAAGIPALATGKMPRKK